MQPEQREGEALVGKAQEMAKRIRWGNRHGLFPPDAADTLDSLADALAASQEKERQRCIAVVRGIADAQVDPVGHATCQEILDALDSTQTHGGPDPECPSCGGTGWATVRAGNITAASGACRCVGGQTWAKHGGSDA